MRKLVNVILKYHKTLVYAVLTAFLCGLFLFSAAPQEDYCGKYIQIGSIGSFPLNCDSWDYIETAQNPVRLFEEKSIRQTRPLYVVLAATLGYVLSPVAAALPLESVPMQDELLKSSFYWGFMLLNFTILLISLLLFDRIADLLTEHKFPQIAKYILAVFLVSNVVIKTSFWSAHQQMLTILSPLLCIYLCLKIVLADDLRARFVYGVSLLGGILLLCYGNFLVMLPAILLAVLIQLFRANSFSLKNAARICVPSGLIFVAPMALWSAILIFVNGKVYSHEAEVYRQFLWIKDKLAVSFTEFYNQLITFASLYWTSLYRTVLIFLVALLTIKTYNFFFQTSGWRDEMVVKNNRKAGVVAIILMLYALFFLLMGYYSERLTFTLVPVVLCLIVLELNLLLTRAGALTVKAIYVVLLICAGFWIYSNVTAYGPFRDLSTIQTTQPLKV